MAVAVAEYLHLNVARSRNIFLDKHAIIAESGFGLALRGCQCRLEFFCLFDAPHAFAAAACNRLDQYGVADVRGFFRQARGRLIVSQITRHHSDARLRHERFRAVFESHRPDRAGRRPHEDDSRRLARLGESGVLRQKPVAGMDGLGFRPKGRRNDRINVQIAFAGRRRPDMHGLVSGGNMGCAGIGIGINRNGAHPPYRFARFGNAHDDLAAIGNQEGCEGSRHRSASKSQQCFPAEQKHTHNAAHDKKRDETSGATHGFELRRGPNGDVELGQLAHRHPEARRARGARCLGGFDPAGKCARLTRA